MHTEIISYKHSTVGMYSPGNELVVYDINVQVLPTAPDPQNTIFRFCIPFELPFDAYCKARASI